MLRQLLLCSLATVLLGSLQAQEPEQFGMASTPEGLSTGTQAPTFTAKDQFGNQVNLPSLLKRGPVVLIFYRGDWCPVCNRHLKNFQDSISVLANLGAQVVAVTPETNANIQNTLKKTNVMFRVLSDTDESIMKDYRVAYEVTESYQKKIKDYLGDDIAKNNAQDKAVLPVPATYIIAQDGTIRWKQFNIDYKQRASIKEIATALQSM